MNYSVIKRKKAVGEFKMETLKKIWIDEFIALRRKAYSFVCNDKNTNNLKINLDECKKCLDGEKYQKECDIYNIRSLNHELYLQSVNKSTLSKWDVI